MSILRMTTGCTALFNFELTIISVGVLFMKLTQLPVREALCDCPRGGLITGARGNFNRLLAWMQAAVLKSNRHWRSRPRVPNSLETLS